MCRPTVEVIRSDAKVSQAIIFKRIQSFTQVQHKDNCPYSCAISLCPNLCTFHLTLRFVHFSRLILLPFLQNGTIKINQFFLNGYQLLNGNFFPWKKPIIVQKSLKCLYFFYLKKCDLVSAGTTFGHLHALTWICAHTRDMGMKWVSILQANYE